MNNDDPDLHRTIFEVWPIVWPLLGGLGGAIISLGLSKNEKLSARRKAFNVLGATIFATFVGPVFVRMFLGVAARADSELVGAVYCLTGLCSMSLLETIVKKAQAAFERFPIPTGKDPE